MRLIVAEKPSVGRNIAKALGINGSGREFIQGKDAIITWCVGHLVELAMPEDYDSALKRWTWDSLPIIPEQFQFKVQDQTKAQYDVIRKLMHDNRITEVVNACDSGREGELIFDLVYLKAGCKKPVLRLWCSSMTDDALRKAYNTMKPAAAYSGLRDSAHCRQRGDWLVGISGTRAQSLYARMKGVQLQGAASIGRVQTPVLKLIYDRDEAIRTFVPQDFWNILGDFSVNGASYVGKWFRKDKDKKDVDRFDKEADAKALVASLKGLPAQIIAVEQKDVRRPPEQLYDLTTLQRECNKRFGLSAEETLGIAQQLYEEHKVLSYPRTNSRHLTPAEEAELPKLLEDLERQPRLLPIIQEIRDNAYDQKKLDKRFVDASKVEDHTAIIPTGEMPGQLTAKQQQVYDLVVRRTLAMFFPDRIEAKTTILTQVGSELFKTNGTVCKDEGWSRIDPPNRSKEKSEDDEESGALPSVKKGDAPNVEKIYTKKGQTTPPKPYSEADLLGAMETAGRFVEDEQLKAAMKDSGLGTPATRANIIETLIKRGFVERKRTTLSVTPSGRLQIESIPVEEIKSPALTGDWEAKLAKMSRGQYDRNKFMAEVCDFTRHLVDAIRSSAGSPEQIARMGQPTFQPKETGVPCPKGDGSLVLKSWNGLFYVKCSGKDCKVTYAVDYNESEHGTEPGQMILVPTDGTCRFGDCGGPVRKTKNGSTICVKCDQWQNDGPPPAIGEPTTVQCNRCSESNYNKVKRKQGSGSFLLCPKCNHIRDVKAKVKAAGCKKCGGNLVERYGKFFACAAEGCDYTENPDGAPASVGTYQSPEDYGKPCPRCEKHNLNLLKLREPSSDGSKTDLLVCPDKKKCGFITSYPAVVHKLKCECKGAGLFFGKTAKGSGRRYWECAKCQKRMSDGPLQPMPAK